MSIWGYVRPSIRPSVSPSICPSVHRSHTSWISDISDISTEMKQNSTKNKILSNLEDIKAKIQQKSINNIKLPFEGPFKDKYAGRSPERILCLYSVRLRKTFYQSWPPHCLILTCVEPDEPMNQHHTLQSLHHLDDELLFAVKNRHISL